MALFTFQQLSTEDKNEIVRPINEVHNFFFFTFLYSFVYSPFPPLIMLENDKLLMLGYIVYLIF